MLIVGGSVNINRNQPGLKPRNATNARKYPALIRAEVVVLSVTG